MTTSQWTQVTILRESCSLIRCLKRVAENKARSAQMIKVREKGFHHQGD